MSQYRFSVCAIGSAIALSLSTQAQSNPGVPIVVPQDGSTVTVAFVSSDAAFTGQLSFLGSGTDLQVTQPAADTGIPGLGQETFVNQLGGTNPIVLQGMYNAGDVLHFAYRVTSPIEAVDTLRTDAATDISQYSWDASTGLLSVEDLRPDHPWYDADFNDIVVRVTFGNVPGPGTAMIGAICSLAFAGRRRRTA